MNIKSYKIEKLNICDYEKCNNIWNMSDCELTNKFRQEIESLNRNVFIFKINDEFIGEIAYVLDTGDLDYTIPNRRVYISRLIVKTTHRNMGIGSILVDYILNTVKSMGYTEATIGVDKNNPIALHLYKKKGFTNIIYDGKDETGEYYKLLKKL